MVNYTIEEADAALETMTETILSEFNAACDKIDAEHESQSVIFDSVNRILNEDLITEMAISPSRMVDKYGEAISAIIDNMVCICLYQNNPTIPHWKSRISGLCERFIDLDINPLSNNKPDYRYRILMKGVYETLNEDYSAILNHFKSSAQYYAKQPKPNTILPLKPYQKCYQENKKKMEKGIEYITQCVANQDMTALTTFVEMF